MSRMPGRSARSKGDLGPQRPPIPLGEAEAVKTAGQVAEVRTYGSGERAG